MMKDQVLKNVELEEILKKYGPTEEINIREGKIHDNAVAIFEPGWLCWNYEWVSSRALFKTKHCFIMYLLQLNEQQDWEVVEIHSSPGFLVTSGKVTAAKQPGPGVERSKRPKVEREVTISPHPEQGEGAVWSVCAAFDRLAVDKDILDTLLLDKADADIPASCPHGGLFDPLASAASILGESSDSKSDPETTSESSDCGSSASSKDLSCDLNPASAPQQHLSSVKMAQRLENQKLECAQLFDSVYSSDGAYNQLFRREIRSFAQENSVQMEQINRGSLFGATGSSLDNDGNTLARLALLRGFSSLGKKQIELVCGQNFPIVASLVEEDEARSAQDKMEQQEGVKQEQEGMEQIQDSVDIFGDGFEEFNFGDTGAADESLTCTHRSDKPIVVLIRCFCSLFLDCSGAGRGEAGAGRGRICYHRSRCQRCHQ
jgi:hypothetical protein